MKRIRSEVNELKNILKMYRNGNLSEEDIAKIEANNNMPIADIIADIEDILYQREHCLVFMTLPRLRRWAKSRAQLSDDEKLVYAAVNGVTYEEFEVVALDYLARWEAIELEKKIRREYRKTEKQRDYFDSLVEKGEAVKEEGIFYCAPIDKVLENINPQK